MSTWTPDREELAWAAGFFDGEGHIRASRSGTWTGARITVVQACTSPIESDDEPPVLLTRFRDAFGVNGYLRYRGPSVPGAKHRWDLTYSTRETVQHVVTCMWPWLGPVKREQATKAISGYSQNQVWPITHCKHGHEFTEQNTRRELRADGGVHRVCRACQREGQRTYRLRKIAALSGGRTGGA